MADKSKYTSGNVRTNSLKRIVILFDHERISNIEAWIDVLKNEFCFGILHRYIPIVPDTKEFYKRNPHLIAERLGIHVRELMQDPIHFFFDNTPGAEYPYSFSLEVSRYTLGLTIEIDGEHLSLDRYFKYAENIINRLYSFDSYVNIKRIGIRKYDRFLFDTRDELIKDLEEDIVFSQKIDHLMGNLERNYVDRYHTTSYLNICYRRLLRGLQDTNDNFFFQVIIDTDVFVDSSYFKIHELQLPSDTSRIFKKLNDKSFELFRNSVTQSYLERNYIHG